MQGTNSGEYLENINSNIYRQLIANSALVKRLAYTNNRAFDNPVYLYATFLDGIIEPGSQLAVGLFKGNSHVRRTLHYVESYSDNIADFLAKYLTVMTIKSIPYKSEACVSISLYCGFHTTVTDNFFLDHAINTILDNRKKGDK